MQKRIVFPDPLKQGLQVEFLKIEGLFCKIADDVRPEAIAGLLLLLLYYYYYIILLLLLLLAKGPVRCNGRNKSLYVIVCISTSPAHHIVDNGHIVHLFTTNVINPKVVSLVITSEAESHRNAWRDQTRNIVS